MIPAASLSRVRADQLPSGSVAWIDGQPTPVLVAHSAEQVPDGETAPILLMDLGGEQPFDIWISDHGRDTMALVLTEFRLEVDPIAWREQMLTARDHQGCAFIAPGGMGLVGSKSRHYGSIREPMAFTLDGEVMKISHDSGALAIGNWKIVHGHGDEAFVIYEHSVTADKAKAAA